LNGHVAHLQWQPEPQQRSRFVGLPSRSEGGLGHLILLMGLGGVHRERRRTMDEWTARDRELARHLMGIWESSRDALTHLGVLRSRNVVGDYAEWVTACALGLQLSESKLSRHDATDREGRRYQVKARSRDDFAGTVFTRLHPDDFDVLVLMVFGPKCEVSFAARIAAADVRRLLNASGGLVLTETVLQDSAVENITTTLR